MNRMTTLLRAISPNCRQAARLQSEALDRSLPMLPRIGLRIHLLLCKWCRRYGEQLHFLRKAAHEHSDELAPCEGQTLSPKARERIKETLRVENEQNEHL